MIISPTRFDFYNAILTLISESGERKKYDVFDGTLEYGLDLYRGRTEKIMERGRNAHKVNMTFFANERVFESHEWGYLKWTLLNEPECIITINSGYITKYAIEELEDDAFFHDIDYKPISEPSAVIIGPGFLQNTATGS